jgi:hypothetical protein
MGSSDRRPYETASTLDQALLNECAGNLVCDLRMICTIDVPTGSFPTDTLYLSDRNMIVGEHFYSARVTFPKIKRTVGEILTPVVKFSTQTITVNNSDGYFNSILPGGADYDSFINRRIRVSIGLGELQSTYDSNIIFEGFITEVGGFSRAMNSFTIVARDQFDDLNATFPRDIFDLATYPDIDDSVLGSIKPIIIGDWTTNVEETKGASIPAFIVNTLDDTMNGETSNVTNVKLVISGNVNRSFDNTSVVLVRSSLAFPIDSADIINVNGDNNYFEINQNGTTSIDGSPYEFKSSDKFFCKVTGVSIDGPNTYADNAVEQARWILTTYGGATSFSSSWNTLRDKAAPSESAIFNIKSRVYVQKQEKALTYALSLLEQIRCEAFINRSQEIDIATNHWEDFEDNPSTIVTDWDIERNTLKPAISERNNFNRCQGFFNFIPDLKENYQSTALFKVQASIDQSKEVTKGLVFSNLYINTDVENQVKEYLKFTSAFREDINVTVSWKFLLIELDRWLNLAADIGGTQFDGVPIRVRDITFDSKGMKIILRAFSFQMMPFKTWNPGYAGIVGGQNAVITT